MSKKQFTLYLVCVGIVCLACNLIHPVTPTLIVERELDSSMFGVALAAMYLSYFCFSPFWGRLCDYTSSRKVIIISIIGYALGQAAFWAAKTETAVILARFFAGGFSGGFNTALLNNMINTTEVRDRNRRITLYATVYNVCNASGYFVGGLLGLISVSAAFAAAVALLLFGAALVRIVSPDDTPYKLKPAGPLSFRDANPLSAFFSVREFMTPALFLFFACVVTGHVGQTAYEQVFNYFIKDQLHLSSAYNGIFKAAIAVLTFLINSFLLSKLLKTRKPEKLLLPAVVLSAPLVASIYFTFAAAPLAVCYILFLVLGNVKSTLYNSTLAERGTPESSNRLMGLLQAMLGLGGIIGALLSGLLYKKSVLAPFTLAFGTLCLAVLLYFLFLHCSKKEA